MGEYVCMYACMYVFIHFILYCLNTVTSSAKAAFQGAGEKFTIYNLQFNSYKTKNKYAY